MAPGADVTDGVPGPVGAGALFAGTGVVRGTLVTDPGAGDGRTEEGVVTGVVTGVVEGADVGTGDGWGRTAKEVPTAGA